MMDYEGAELIALLLKVFTLTLISGIIFTGMLPARHRPAISIATVSLVAVITSIPAVICFTNGSLELLHYGGNFLGNIAIRIDKLSAWFILVINITSVTGVIYGAGYLSRSAKKPVLLTFHWILFIIFQSSMLLVVMIQHGIAFLVAWEIMSLSSLFLVLFENEDPKVLKAGINYLVQMHLSVVLLTVAFIWAYLKSNTFDFAGIGTFFAQNKNLWLFLIFFAGFGIKAGFLGLHTWLPKAHPAAPSHISGVMSGVIVKMGIYGIFRMLTYLRSDYLVIGGIILALSVLTGLFGIMNAAVHRDFKKMLAYCTIENIGIIGIGIGLGILGLGTGQPLMSFLGFSGALLHVLNHSLFKSLLFFSAGSVYRQTHTRNMDELGGILKYMPVTGTLFLTGAIAIGAIPPLNGFISEFLIYGGIIKGFSSQGIAFITLMIITFAALSLIGGISILTFTKTFGTIFLGSPRSELKNDLREVSVLMLIPQFIIIVIMLIIAFFPSFMLNLSGRIIGNEIHGVTGLPTEELREYGLIMRNISISSMAFLAITGLVLLLRKALTVRSDIQYSPTWGCSYGAPDEKMQYTGKSFSKSFGKLLNFVIPEKKDYPEIAKDEYFPVNRSYRSTYPDIIGSKIIEPSLSLITRFFNLFQFIQNGRIQAYVIYGIAFIVIILIGTILNLWH